jgi:broad specificity phosphatase PhoE
LRLHLVAHAPTQAQRAYRFASKDDAIEAIAEARAAQLTARLHACQRAWCAPERRSLETCHALGLDATPSQALRAWHMGAWTGQLLASIAERDPAGFEAWHTDPDAAPHGGESLLQLLSRVATWLDMEPDASGQAVVVADAAVLRAVVVLVLQASPPTFWRFDLPPLSLSIVQHARGQWRLRHLVLLD